jgi:hypothetical protein
MEGGGRETRSAKTVKQETREQKNNEYKGDEEERIKMTRG